MSPLYTVFKVLNLDKNYLEQYFRSNCWHLYMKLNGDSGARSDRFAIKDTIFFDMPIPFPGEIEQKLIGDINLIVDNFITLHQRKHSNYYNKPDKDLITRSTS